MTLAPLRSGLGMTASAITGRLKPPVPEPEPQAPPAPLPVAAYWQSRAEAAAMRHGIDPTYFAAQIGAESGWAEDVISGRRRSSAGAIGIAQFMPATAAEYGIDPTNPEEALDGAARYMADNLRAFGGDARAAAAAYNAGAGRVAGLQRERGAGWESGLPAETQAYLGRIFGAASAAATPGGARGLTPQYTEQAQGLTSSVYATRPDRPRYAWSVEQDPVRQSLLEETTARLSPDQRDVSLRLYEDSLEQGSEPSEAFKRLVISLRTMPDITGADEVPPPEGFGASRREPGAGPNLRERGIASGAIPQETSFGEGGWAGNVVEAGAQAVEQYGASAATGFVFGGPLGAAGAVGGQVASEQLNKRLPQGNTPVERFARDVAVMAPNILGPQGKQGIIASARGLKPLAPMSQRARLALTGASVLGGRVAEEAGVDPLIGETLGGLAAGVSAGGVSALRGRGGRGGGPVMGMASEDIGGRSRRVSKNSKTGDTRLTGLPPGVVNEEHLQALTDRVRKAAVDGESGRFFYETSGAAIKNLTQGDPREGDILARIVALTSVDTSVAGQAPFILRAWGQYTQGKPISGLRYGTVVKNVDLATKASPEEWGKVIVGWIKGGDANKEKLANFYLDLLDEVDFEMAAKLRVESGSTVTIDRWMNRLFGYATDARTPAQYEFMAGKVIEVGKELGWTPKQVQAAMWATQRTATADDAGKVLGRGLDYADVLRQNIAQVSWESAPGSATLRETKLSDAIQSALPEQRQEHHYRIAKAFQDDQGRDMLARALRLPWEGEFHGPGVWQGNVTPGSQAQTLVGTSLGSKGLDDNLKTAVSDYAALKGYVLQQDAMAWTRPMYSANVGKQNGLSVSIGRAISNEEAAQLSRTLGDSYAVVPTKEGAWLFNFEGDVPNKKAQLAMIAAGDSVWENSDLAPKYRGFATDGDYISNDWKENPNGEGYLRGRSAAGRPDVRAILDTLQRRVNEVDDWFAKEVAHPNRATEGTQGGLGGPRPQAPDAGVGRAPDVPAVVYHGTTRTAAEAIRRGGFKATEAMSRTMGGLVPHKATSPAFFFTADQGTARSWGGNRAGNGRDVDVLRAEIDLRKPFRLDDADFMAWDGIQELREHPSLRGLNEDEWAEFGLNAQDLEVVNKDLLPMLLDDKRVVNALKDLGYDGAILDEGTGAFGGKSFAVFDASQVKLPTKGAGGPTASLVARPGLQSVGRTVGGAVAQGAGAAALDYAENRDPESAAGAFATGTARGLAGASGASGARAASVVGRGVYRTIPQGEEPGPEFAKNIRLAKYPEAVRGVIRDWALENEAEVTTARRGTRTVETTTRAAQKLVEENFGLDFAKLQKSWKPGQAWNADELVAIRGALRDKTKAVADLAALIQTEGGDSSANLLKFEQALLEQGAVQSIVHGTTAEAGRALQSFKAAAKNFNTVGTDTTEKMAELLKRLGGKEGAKNLAAGLATLDINDPAKVNHFLRNARKPGLKDYLYEIWVNSILSGPKTHLVNLGSAITSMTLSPIERGLAAGVDAVLAPLSGRARARYFEAAPADVIGAVHGVKEGFDALLYTLRNGFTPTAGTKWDFRETAFKGKLGRIIRAPGTALEATDAMNYAIMYRSSLWANATNQARREGLTGSALTRRLDELLTEPTPALIKLSSENANYRLYRAPPKAWTGALLGLREKIPPLKYVLPFITTPVNVLKFGLERSPAGLLDPRLYKLIAAGDPEASDKIARVILGSGIAAAVAWQFGEGNITGAAPKSSTERDRFFREGKLPYAIKVGGKWVSYQRLEPLNQPLSQVAAVYDAVKNDEKDVAGKVEQAVTSIGTNLVSQTYMTGLKNAMDAITRPEQYGPGFLTKTATGLVPFSSALRQASQMADPAYRSPAGLVEAVKAGIPGFTSDVPTRLNAFGEVSNREAPYSPIAISTVKNDPVNRELAAYGVEVPFVGKTLGGEELPKDEQHAYQALAGQATKRVLDDVIGRQEYRRATPIGKEVLLEQAISTARSMVRERLDPEAGGDRSILQRDAGNLPEQIAKDAKKYFDLRADRIKLGYDLYDPSTGKTRSNPEADSVALDKANPDVDVAGWYFSSAKSPQTLQTTKAAEMALADNPDGRPVKLSWLARPINESGGSKEAWEYSKKPLDWYNGELIEANKEAERQRLARQNKDYNKPWEQLEPSQRGSITGNLRETARKQNPELDAFLVWWGEGKLHSKAAGAIFEQIMKRYGSTPPTKDFKVEYTADAR